MHLLALVPPVFFWLGFWANLRDSSMFVGHDRGIGVPEARREA